MAKSLNQKQKVLYILDILKEKSDDKHVVNVNNIITMLEEKGIKAERKSIYSDIETLTSCGYDIVLKKGRGGGYYLRSREFESSELKILADAVQSSEFITYSRTSKIISKLKRFESEYKGEELYSFVQEKSKLKKINNNVYSNTELIQSAISKNAKIRFSYYGYNLNKRHHSIAGRVYAISPWVILWEDGVCHLIAYDASNADIRHFRVDKMLNVRVLENQRDGNDFFDEFSAEKYANEAFGIYSEQSEYINLLCSSELVDEIIDKFGKSTQISKLNDNTLSVNIKAKSSRGLFGWITGLGRGITIEGPDNVKVKYREYLQEILQKYI